MKSTALYEPLILEMKKLPLPEVTWHHQTHNTEKQNSGKNSSLTPHHLYGTNDFSHNVDFLEKCESLKVRYSKLCLELLLLIGEGGTTKEKCFQCCIDI